MNYALVQFSDDDRVKKVVRVSSIRDALSEEPLRPKAATDFKAQKDAYEVKWQKSDVSSDGYYPGSIICLAGSVDEAVAKGADLGIKFHGQPLLELPSSATSNDKEHNKIGSKRKARDCPTKETAAKNPKTEKRKVKDSSASAKKASSKSQSEKSEVAKKPKPNPMAKNPAVLERMAQALQDAKKNPILHDGCKTSVETVSLTETEDLSAPTLRHEQDDNAKGKSGLFQLLCRNPADSGHQQDSATAQNSSHDKDKKQNQYGLGDLMSSSLTMTFKNKQEPAQEETGVEPTGGTDKASDILIASDSEGEKSSDESLHISSSDSEESGSIKLSKENRKLIKQLRDIKQEKIELQNKLDLNLASLKVVDQERLSNFAKMRLLQEENDHLHSVLQKISDLSSEKPGKQHAENVKRNLFSAPSPSADPSSPISFDEPGANSTPRETLGRKEETPPPKPKPTPAPTRKEEKTSRKSKKVDLIKDKGVNAVSEALLQHMDAFKQNGTLPCDSEGMFEVCGVKVHGSQFLENIKENYGSDLNVMTRQMTTMMWSALQRRERSLFGKVSNRFKDATPKSAATPSKVDFILGSVKFALKYLQNMEENTSMETLLKSQRTVIGNRLNQEDQKVKRKSNDE